MTSSGAQVGQRRADAGRQRRVGAARSPAPPGCAPTRPSARRRRRAARRARPTSPSGTSASVAARPRARRGVDLVDRRAAAGASAASQRRCRSPSRNSSATVPGPAGLVAGAEAGAVVAVEVLVEQQQVAPVRVGLELLDAAVHRPAAVLVRAGTSRVSRPAISSATSRRFSSRPEPVGHSTLKSVAVVAVQLEQRAQDHEVHREPHRPAPVRVAAEHAGVRLRRQVADLVVLAAPVELVRVVEVVARDRADAVRRRGTRPRRA